MHLELFFSLGFQVYKLGSFYSTGFYFKSKVIEDSHKGKNVFFNFWALLLKIYHLCVCDIFFSSSGYPVNSIFSAVRIYKIHVLDEAFFLLTIRIPTVTHKYAWLLNRVVFLCHVTNKTHFSTCSRCIYTAIGKVLT